jgi:NTP pyrophosphatase (non-canonical NTP hydrolase)
MSWTLTNKTREEEFYAGAFDKKPNDQDERAFANRNDYRKSFLRFAIYDNWRKTTDVSQHTDLSYPALGMNGEAGEVAEKVKKVLRDRGGVVDEDTRRLILLECGDVLWYVAQMASRLGSSLAEVALMNVEKLESRKARGVLKGSGDDR